MIFLWMNCAVMILLQFIALYRRGFIAGSSLTSSSTYSTGLSRACQTKLHRSVTTTTSNNGSVATFTAFFQGRAIDDRRKVQNGEKLQTIHKKESSGRLFRQSFIFSTSSDSSSEPQDSINLNSVINKNQVDTKDKARLVFLGTPDVAAASLFSLIKFSKEQPHNCCYDVVGVVTQPPKRRRRKGKPEPTPVAKIAKAYGIPDTSILTPLKASDPSFLDALENDLKPDLCITAAYGQYLPKRFLAMPSLGTINIHPSLLPRWRGASPVQRSLEAGDDPIGVSLLYTVSKMDAGPIICQKQYHCGPNEQATDVLAYLLGLGTACLIESLPHVISGRMTFDKATIQNDNEVVKANMIDVTEGELRPWKESAMCAHNKVRGFSTWPGTWLYLNIGSDNDNKSPTRLKIIETRVRPNEDVENNKTNDNNSASMNHIIELGSQKGSGLLVTCYDGSVLELLKVQPETKKVMDAKSFVNGLRGQTIEWIVMPEKEMESDQEKKKENVAATTPTIMQR